MKPEGVEAYEAKMKALGKAIKLHWFDAGHGSLVVDQAIEHHELMLRFARRVGVAEGLRGVRHPAAYAEKRTNRDDR